MSDSPDKLSDLLQEYKTLYEQKERSKDIDKKISILYMLNKKSMFIRIQYRSLINNIDNLDYNEYFEIFNKELENYEELILLLETKEDFKKNMDFKLLLIYNNLLFSYITQERNLIVHSFYKKSFDEFFNETYPNKINKMIKNLEKIIEIILWKIEQFKSENDLRNMSYYYEIKGDIHVHIIALLKYYSKYQKVRYTKEAEKVIKSYNEALKLKSQDEISHIGRLSIRVPDYMKIFEDFFLMDEKERIISLDQKLSYLQEKYNIWRKSLPKVRFSTKPIKGFEDLFPSGLREIKYILSVIEDVVDLYSYEEYEGPLLEPIEIFAAKSSEELVNEQAFIVEKVEDKRLILRPEITPTLARMVAQKSKELKKPIRWFSFPKCYRYEQPQKGRVRAFLQLNVDILAENSLYAELEIFNITIDILTSLGATAEQFQVYYNNRRFIDAVCVQILKISEDKIPIVYKVIDKSGKMDEAEFEKYVIDTFQDETIVQGIFKLKDAKSIKELLNRFDDIPKEFHDSEGYKEITELENLLEKAGLSEYCSFSSSIVRGLDYYTGTVFEVLDTGKENRRSIFGGGRYDDLLSIFSDEQITGIGFGAGILMISLFLETYDLIPEDIAEKDYTDTIYIASINDKVDGYALEIARTLREEDFPCMIDYRFKGLKNQLSKANELGVLISIILGPKEMEQRKVTIKNMATEEQKTIKFENLIEEIYEIFDEIEDSDDIADE